MADPPLILLDSTFVIDLDEPHPQLWHELRRRLGPDASRALKPLDLLLVPSACQLSTVSRVLGTARLSPATLTLMGSLFLRV